MTETPARKTRPAGSQTSGATKPARKPLEKPADGSPILLSGGNPQIPKGTGNAPVEAYLAAMPGWKQAIGRRLDALIVATLPDVRKAVKWNTPFYSVDGAHWFLGFHCLAKYVKVAFPDGAQMEPQPPGTSKQARVRYLDIYEGDEVDEGQFADWVRQASRLPGEKL